MNHHFRKTIDRAAQAGLIVLATVLGGTAMAETPTLDAPVPLAFEPRQSAPSPARPVASSWGAYAVETHKRIEQHLKANRETFKFRTDLYVELWIGPNGRVMRTRVTGATGNRSFDAMPGPDFPPGLMLPPPAKDMPQPIKVKINADR